MAQNLIWIGVGFGLSYWLLESLIHVTVFSEGNFLQQVFTPDAHEIWKRLLVIVLIILFSIYAQRSINIRRRTETALADREKELSLILENNPAGILLIDRDSHRVSWANNNALKMIGTSREAVENHDCRKYLCSSEINGCPILDSDQEIDLSERELLTSSNELLPILKSVTHVQYNGRKHLLEAFFDLSDRKKMERDLQQAHAELDQIFQTASVAMRLVGNNYQVLKINKTFEHLTGVKEADAVQKKCHEIFSGSTCFTDQCPIHRIKSGLDTVESYVDKNRPDGKRIPCILTATPFVGPDGDIIGVVESFRDITDLKRAQNAVESERDKLEQILSHLQTGVSIINSNHLLEYENDPFNEYFGNCTGKPCYAAIHGEQRPCEPCLMQTAIKTGRIQQSEFKTPDGRSFEKDYAPVMGIDDQSNVVALFRDVTEKKAATAAIMRAEQLAALGELAAGVAHEINNPINGIINYAQILFNRPDESGQVHEISTRLLKEGDRIARIVEGLLSFGRRHHEDKALISINKILSDSISLTAAQLRKDNIIVHTEFTVELSDIMAQAHEIEQVFVNIISNARHALNAKYPGPHDNKRLEIRAEQVNANSHRFVQVSFKDFGCGIPPDVIDKVMNPFFSTKTEGKRTGLGLSISHGIMEEHGGRLNIESQENQYTKVVTELPVHISIPQ